MLKLVLKAFLFSTVFFVGMLATVIAMQCERGRLLLVNTLNVEQPDLRLFARIPNRPLLWAGSLGPGDVEELVLPTRYGENLMLEGVNAETGQRFSELSPYFRSMTPYGTNIYLIEPYGIRTISFGWESTPEDHANSVLLNFLHVGLREAFYATRCVDEDFWWWLRH